MFYIKSPTPFFRHPQREHSHSFPKPTCKFLEGEEGMCAYSPIPCARDTPCFSATLLTPCSLVSTSGPLTPSR